MSREQLTARLADARRSLALAMALRTALVAITVGIAVVVALAFVDLVVALPAAVRGAGGLLALAATGAVLLRDWFRHVGPAFRAPFEQVALWFEERIPSLRYALVTFADLGASGGRRAVDTSDARATEGALLAAVEGAPLEAHVRSATRTALTKPLLLTVIAAVLIAVLPDGAVARVTAPRAGDLLERPGAAGRAAADPLATIVVRLRPPAYAGLAVEAFDDPSSVRGLVGSEVVVEGRGRDVRAVVGDSARAVRSGGDRWSLTLPMPKEPTGVRLRGPARERVLVLEPVVDSAPAIRLDEPTRDTVLRAATGTIELRAGLRDDHGLADAAFEFIVSSGSGEAFTFRGGRLAAAAYPAGTRAARITGALRLDTLKLAPGDLVHLRAVARDRNDVTGPGTGASETRTLRIARPDEYDSVSVDPMPPTEPEKNALSQRMILMMTQELRGRERRIGPAATTAEARRIAIEQTKLRKKVGEIVFTRLGENDGEHEHFTGDGHDHSPAGLVDPDAVLAAAEAAANASANRALESEGDETPIVAINKPLLEAYNHMWRASSELETGQPGAAIPWMERAIAALQRARSAERIYLRGRPPRVVIDLAKVRGTGKEKGAPGVRLARPALDPERAARIARFDAVLDTVVTDPLAAADALLLLRLRLPADERVAAEALTGAADALRRGGDVTAPLQRARRALVGDAERRDALGPWGD